MVNGLPGSGKTTLADAIGTAAGVPVYSKDVLKVAIAQAYGYADDAAEQSRAVGAAAMEAVWTLLAEVPAAVVDSWWEPSSRHFVEAGLVRCGQPDVLEVWCDVSPSSRASVMPAGTGTRSSPMRSASTTTGRIGRSTRIRSVWAPCAECAPTDRSAPPTATRSSRS